MYNTRHRQVTLNWKSRVLYIKSSKQTIQIGLHDPIPGFEFKSVSELRSGLKIPQIRDYVNSNSWFRCEILVIIEEKNEIFQQYVMKKWVECASLHADSPLVHILPASWACKGTLLHTVERSHFSLQQWRGSLSPKSRITVDIITDLGNLKTTPQLAHGFEFKTWNRVIFFHKILWSDLNSLFWWLYVQNPTFSV